MRVVLITQEDRFFLPDSIDMLINSVKETHFVCAAVVSDVSPFGKKERLWFKAWKTLRIFGIRFTIRWAVKYLIALRNSRSVTKVCSNHGLDIIELKSSINSRDSLEKIKEYKPDILVSIAGNQIFKLPLIKLAPKGCINLHSALLPKYRGLMPSFWVLRYREKYSGVSVFQVDEGIDSGPIIVQKRIEIGNMSQEDLIKESKKIGMTAISEALDMIEKEQVQYIENSNKEKSYFSFPARKDVKAFLKSGAKFF